jgi:hypothetical protein
VSDMCKRVVNLPVRIRVWSGDAKPTYASTAPATEAENAKACWHPRIRQPTRSLLARKGLDFCSHCSPTLHAAETLDRPSSSRRILCFVPPGLS